MKNLIKKTKYFFAKNTQTKCNQNTFLEEWRKEIQTFRKENMKGELETSLMPFSQIRSNFEVKLEK
jgi:hypothetical protein